MFNNLGVALGNCLEILNQCGKRLKLEVRKFRSIIPTFVEINGEKLLNW